MSRCFPIGRRSLTWIAAAALPVAALAQTQQSSAPAKSPTFTLSPALAALRRAPLEELARTAPAKDSAFVHTLLTSSDTNARALAANRIATDSGAAHLTLGLL